MGDIGISPAGSGGITGFGLVEDGSKAFFTSTQVQGQVQAADNASPTPGKLTTAIGDVRNAYNVAAGRAGDFTNTGAGELGGLTLAPGVYKYTTGVTISSNVILRGSCGDVFIFQIP